MNGKKEVARASKSAISILMASNVAAIVECQGLILGNMHIKLNALTAGMFMEQMGQICTKESALSVKKEHPESGIGRFSRSEFTS